jgi:hypothetical protein
MAGMRQRQARASQASRWASARRPSGSRYRSRSSSFSAQARNSTWRGAAQLVQRRPLLAGERGGSLSSAQRVCLTRSAAGVGADAAAAAAHDPGGEAGAVPRGAADLVQGVVDQLDHVEGVGTHPGLRRAAAGDLGVGAMQVHRRSGKPGRSVRAELVEEPLEGGARPALATHTTTPSRSWSATTSGSGGPFGRRPRRRRSGELVHAMIVEVGGDHPDHMAATASQEQRSSRVMVVLLVRWAR